jgi:hypothetical protein
MVVIVFRKIVKMKYNWIKWWLVSTSFKIYLDILSNFYITFTIFYYNTISRKCTFFPVIVKGLYQTESYSLHVMYFIIGYEQKPAELQLLKKTWLWSSSVIKIVKMKYNRINIKWWLVSTSFNIYLDILSNLYITFTFIKQNHTVYM